MDCDERPIVHCLVSYPLLNERGFTSPAVVSLQTAKELMDKGWMVVGPDPEDLQALAEYERAQRWLVRFFRDG